MLRVGTLRLARLSVICPGFLTRLNGLLNRLVGHRSHIVFAGFGMGYNGALEDDREEEKRCTRHIENFSRRWRLCARHLISTDNRLLPAAT